MTTLYLHGGEPEKEYNVICFDYDENRYRKIATISMADDPYTIGITDFDNDKTEVNSSKLLEGLLKAVELGWFVPNKESTALLKKLCDRYNIS
jgi:hypothetical protein